MILGIMWKRMGMMSANGAMVKLALLVIGLLAAVTAGAKDEKFLGRALFQRMVGEWTSEGEMSSNGSGDVIYVTEIWTGKFTDDGKGFVVEGNRDWNGEEQTFKWEYSYNAVTDFIEAIYTASNFDEELPMEVSVNEVEGSIMLRAPMGTEGAELHVENRFKEGRLVTRVSVTNQTGQTVFGGDLKHSRKKKDAKEDK